MPYIYSPRVPERIWKCKRIPPKLQARADFQTEYAPSLTQIDNKGGIYAQIIDHRHRMTYEAGRGWEHCLLCHMGNQIHRLSRGAKKKFGREKQEGQQFKAAFVT